MYNVYPLSPQDQINVTVFLIFNKNEDLLLFVCPSGAPYIITMFHGSTTGPANFYLEYNTFTRFLTRHFTI